MAKKKENCRFFSASSATIPPKLLLLFSVFEHVDVPDHTYGGWSQKHLQNNYALLLFIFIFPQMYLKFLWCLTLLPSVSPLIDKSYGDIDRLVIRFWYPTVSYHTPLFSFLCWTFFPSIIVMFLDRLAQVAWLALSHKSNPRGFEQDKRSKPQGNGRERVHILGTHHVQFLSLMILGETISISNQSVYIYSIPCFRV